MAIRRPEAKFLDADPELVRQGAPMPLAGRAHASLPAKERALRDPDPRRHGSRGERPRGEACSFHPQLAQAICHVASVAAEPGVSYSELPVYSVLPGESSSVLPGGCQSMAVELAPTDPQA